MRTINDKCNNCGNCLAVCKENAITAGDIYRIDPAKCTDCLKCVDVCAQKAIAEFVEIPLDFESLNL